MGKQGPCYHCGVKSTPLWRNGPPEKPVLCNACGSRWRTKGTLANYTPLHARPEPDVFEDDQTSNWKPISNQYSEAKIFKRKYDKDLPDFGGFPAYHSQKLGKVFDEDTSNRSSSGSAISNSESCVQYGSADASDLTGPSQPAVWDSVVPSKRRTCVTRSQPSPVEELTKDLYTIWHEQQSSCLSGSSEEELLLESGKPTVSVEIGHGSVLIRHPNSVAHEQVPETSSLSISGNHVTAKTQPETVPAVEEIGVDSSSQGFEDIKNLANPGTERQKIKREMDQLETMRILAHHSSPLCYINLKDVLNLDNFLSHLTVEQQSQLLKFVPSVDCFESPDSLRSMFISPQFEESMCSFQMLLSEGVFDNSSSWIKAEDCRILKRCILFNFKKSKWAEKYQSFKNSKGETCVEGSEKAAGVYHTLAPDYSSSGKTLKDSYHPKFSGANATITSSRRMVMKLSNTEKKQSDNGGSFFSSEFLSSPQNDHCLPVVGTSHFSDASSEQNLVLDVPSNASFPLAELLPKSSFVVQ